VPRRPVEWNGRAARGAEGPEAQRSPNRTERQRRTHGATGQATNPERPGGTATHPMLS